MRRQKTTVQYYGHNKVCSPKWRTDNSSEVRKEIYKTQQGYFLMKILIKNGNSSTGSHKLICIIIILGHDSPEFFSAESDIHND
jgi:hypothetical protein